MNWDIPNTSIASPSLTLPGSSAAGEPVGSPGVKGLTASGLSGILSAATPLLTGGATIPNLDFASSAMSRSGNIFQPISPTNTVSSGAGVRGFQNIVNFGGSQDASGSGSSSMSWSTWLMVAALAGLGFFLFKALR